ncbi:uncharacterized protein BDZ99DRAFT_436124 [Mytilinidion resinicola]|uniref:Uncharacterized protein n=1 Tax=Mytilinidion resinicola TaxID=574789 RepID=A0A6A6YYX2_9PEZI|nr:uncharacterized protein BDZ99DRAFT_436124 [Mytilinidion resinicola]KAF2813699.1 hypothetical protein BDZ99DRAFT_436124 [Mytilinidion resinicola]
MKVKGNSFSTDGQDVEAELDAIIERRLHQDLGPFNGFFNHDRSLDPSDQLDIDLMILDFLAFKTIESVLIAEQARIGGTRIEAWDMPEDKIEMTNHWIMWVAKTHGADAVPTEMASRLKLLEFVLLFTRRLDPEANLTTAASLEKTRKKNKGLAAFMSSRDSFTSELLLPISFDPHTDFPLSNHQLYDNRLRLAAELGVSDPELWAKEYYGTSMCPSLYDLMTDFFCMTAAWAGVYWTANNEWLELAGEWMLQAALEAYLIYGVSGEDLFRDIFSVGCPPLDATRDGLEDEAVREAVDAMQTLFCEPENLQQELADWTEVRESYLLALTPDDSPSIISEQTMESARSKFGIKGFHANIYAFLMGLHLAMHKPDMVQVEEGRIEGVSEEESRQMLENMGVLRLTDEEAAEKSRAAFARAGITRAADGMGLMGSTEDELIE